MIFNGLQSPMLFMQERQMVFGKVIALGIATNVIGLILTIALAFYLRSVWALVLGNLVQILFKTVLSFVFFRGPPMRLCLQRNHLGTVIDRGKWIIGGSALTAISRSGDRLLLGFVMSSSTFGFYYIARQLVDIVHSFLLTLDQRIGLQVFTELKKSNTEAFKRNYYKYRLFFDAIAGLSAGGLIILSPLVVDILFDDRYSGVAPIAQVLIWGVLLVGPLLLRSAFGAERRFRDMMILSLVSVATLWIGMLFAVFVMDSVELAILVIAVFRLPEAMICTLWGGDRGWVLVWREFIVFGFCAVGILLGWIFLFVWNAVV
jgi:O-antigen/teichoic acid export membrane protein